MGLGARPSLILGRERVVFGQGEHITVEAVQNRDVDFARQAAEADVVLRPGELGALE